MVGRGNYVEKLLATVGVLLMALSVYAKWPYVVTIALAILVILLIFVPYGKK